MVAVHLLGGDQRFKFLYLSSSSFLKKDCNLFFWIDSMTRKPESSLSTVISFGLNSKRRAFESNMPVVVSEEVVCYLGKSMHDVAGKILCDIRVDRKTTRTFVT